MLFLGIFDGISFLTDNISLVIPSSHRSLGGRMSRELLRHHGIRRFEILFQIVHDLRVCVGHEAYGHARPARAPRTPNTVTVAHNSCGRVEVNHVRDVRDVQAAARDVSVATSTRRAPLRKRSSVSSHWS